MASSKRTRGRTWATDLLFTLTKAPMIAVEWYELPRSALSEIEVIVQGKKFVRAIKNVELEDEQRRSSLEKIMQELATEINESLCSSLFPVRQSQ